ncbi:hypothetical protein B0E53_06079 [Micromonospora sp. MH33]|nr:hypothetical protein B0E53_06079 [Micromonospora sp. MH33]
MSHPDAVAAPSATQGRPVASVASPGTALTNRNSDPSGDTQAAAPVARLPESSQPRGPPAIRPTFTASAPPNTSNSAGTSTSEPSATCRQVLIRGLPCTPPLLPPTAPSRPSRQPAAVNMFSTP